MGQNEPIEEVSVAIIGDLSQLLEHLYAGVEITEEAFAEMKLEPKQAMEDAQTFGQRIQQAFLGTIERIRQTGQNLWESFSNFFQNATAGFQSVSEAASAATMSQQRLNEVLARGSAEGATLVEELTALVVRLSESSGEPFENIIQGMTQAKQVTTDQASAISKSLGVATGEASGLASAIGGLGKIANSVFGIAFGISALQVLRKFANLLRDSVNDAIALGSAMVRLQVAVRSAQRFSGEMVGSIQAWQNSVVELRETYGNLSNVELQQAAARTIFLTRAMDFNQDQIQRTLTVAAQLATLYNIDMNRAISLVTQGLTGIARGLRLYGVQLSRQILNEEARAQGLRRTWEELDAAERAMVALAVIEKQMAGTTEDLNVILGTTEGRLQTAAARTRDAKAEIGSLTAWIKVLGHEAFASLMEWLAETILGLEELFTRAAQGATLIGVFVAQVQNGVPIWMAMKIALEESTKVTDKMRTAFGLLTDELEDAETGGVWAALADDIRMANDEIQAALDELLRDMGLKFADLEAEYAAAIDEANRELEQDLEDLDRELLEKQAEAYRDFLDDLEDLAIEYGRKREDILLNTQRKLEDLEDKTAEQRAKIMRDLYKKLRRLQEDYQLASQRSRLRFIEDLQDAVANRDAFLAVQLIKRQRQEQRELREDYDVRRRRAIEDARDRLDDIHGSIEEQRAEILKAQERALEDLDRWQERKRDDINRDYAQELADLDRWYARKQREIEIDHRLELEELERHHRARQVELAAALAEEENITEAGAQAIFNALNEVFGPGMQIERMMDAFRQRLATRIEIETRVTTMEIEQPEPYTPWLPTIPLHDWPDTQTAPTPTTIPSGVSINQTSAPGFVSQNTSTLREYGQLEINVSADEHFSQDFEEKVSNQIASFVGNVIVKPRRMR